MSDNIVPWKNTGEKDMAQRGLFKIRWDLESGKWVPDKNGPHLGYFVKGEGLAIKKYIPPETETPKPQLILGTPTLGVVANDEEE